MIRTNNTQKLGKYDTTLNVIGGLKDCNVIYRAIASYFSDTDSIKALISDRNEFNLRTERSRTRIESAVRVAFFNFKNQDHLDLLHGIFIDTIPLSEKELILFWQFALSNRLFREISSQVFMKILHIDSGRAIINSLANNSPDANRKIDIMYFTSCALNNNLELTRIKNGFKKYLYINCFSTL